MQLNPHQQEAVTYMDGPLLVLAGAGSGKTRVITEKITRLITRAGYPPEQIAAITFTNKAAGEMRERINRLLENRKTRGLTVCTFHALGMRILREHAEAAGYKKQFSVFDAADAGKIIAELTDSSGREQLFRTQHRISLWKNALFSPETAFQQADNEWERQTAMVYAGYQDTLASYQAVDFDDLIRIPTLLLRDVPDIRYKWQLRLRYLLIDECQDTNTCQYDMMRLLTGADGLFTAVGDDDQSIYAWRGADMENLRRLQQDYPQLKTIKLEQNYRSTARILRVANRVIANNPKLFAKTLWSEFAPGHLIDVVTCRDARHEAETVADAIALQMLTGKAMHTAYQDFAVLYRGNHQARIFEEAFRSRRIPYKISGGQSFFDKAEIKDVLAYIRLLANADDDPAFLRAVTTPRRGLGGSAIAKLHSCATAHGCSLFRASRLIGTEKALSDKQQQSLDNFVSLIDECTRRAVRDPAGEVLQYLLGSTNFENFLQSSEEGKSGEIKWRNVSDLCSWLERKGREDGKTLIDLSQTIALMTLLEGKDGEEVDAVRMSTLHASKGLEYPYVFIVGCEEGLFPHADSIEEGNIEEERRLMYVGITRAQKKLTITCCSKRKRAGNWQFPEPSRFIAEMPSDDLRFVGKKDAAKTVSFSEGKSILAGILSDLDKKKSASKNS